ncbi:MAG: hypothetical protein F6K47_42240 [Symploca sp. SIO2E6]|nr:hypothetical protein [Symploca sp. SIO2E6]
MIDKTRSILFPEAKPSVVVRHGVDTERKLSVSDTSIAENGHSSAQSGFRIIETDTEPVVNGLTIQAALKKHTQSKIDQPEDLPPSYLKLEKMIGLESVKESMLEAI